VARPHPKPLTELRDGRTILAQQLGNLRSVYGREAEILVVVGFKLEMILEAAPDVTFAYNEVYDRTNTSKSLLKALRVTGDRGVLWMNGDVVFHPDVLRRVQPLVDEGRSFVCVNTASVGDEEVKYTVDDEGNIAELSKTVGAEALGEAVGINYVAPAAKATLLRRLAQVDDEAYFERGLELAIERDGMRVTPVDISDLYAVEVDFAEDLERANQEL
jgi:choline kinase